MKHTPGPWIVDPENQLLITTEELNSVGETIGKAVLYSDARLIAATPDLLASLSRLIDAAVAVYDGKSEDFPGLVEATESACRVYEKATGV